MQGTSNIPAEDRSRLARLHQEVAGRLYEAALIGSRVLGLKGEIRKIRLLTPGEEGPPALGGSSPEQCRTGPRPQMKVGVGGGRVTLLGHRLWFVTDDGCGYEDLDEEVCVSAPCW